MDALPQIQQAGLGDLEAFNQIVLENQSIVFNYVLWLVNDHASAEDLTQETFIRAFQHLRKYRGGSIRAWLLRIAANASLDELRRRKRHTMISLTCFTCEDEEVETPPWLKDPGSSTEEKIVRQELCECLQQHLNQLPEAYRQAILLVDVLEMDYAEAATAMGIPMGTVKSRLARARMLMRKRLVNASENSPLFSFRDAWSAEKEQL
ncbi:MAG: RNA polymerase sigma factor [Anaerolineales bacterium]|jgi:RNA polymerase sigma-70 factor (ECF subfamily)|nr:RNA polymerase sigma factor [Anaerolineales bacterium]